MEFLGELWLPIVVSAVFVWIASFFMHMVFPHHKKEFVGLQDEQIFFALEGVKSGQYMFPWGSMEDWKKPEFQEKMKRGPVGTLSIWTKPTNFPLNLLLMLTFYLIVGVFVAYIGWNALGGGAKYLDVFRICGTAAFMAHALGWIPNMIWFAGWKCFGSYFFDSVVYTLLTAGTFGWLWVR